MKKAIVDHRSLQQARPLAMQAVGRAIPLTDLES
jgi:hypothetical protein